MTLKGFLCSIAIALSPLIAATGEEGIIVETSHVTIESKEGQPLRVVFAPEDRPALIFKPKGGTWDWSRESRLVIPVENPSDQALALLLRVEDHKRRSLTGQVAGLPPDNSIGSRRPARARMTDAQVDRPQLRRTHETVAYLARN